MIKRNTLSILISVILTAGSIRAQWNSEACPSRNDLNAVCFVNMATGWAVGDNGTILNKINGKIGRHSGDPFPDTIDAFG